MAAPPSDAVPAVAGAGSGVEAAGSVAAALAGRRGQEVKRPVERAWRAGERPFVPAEAPAATKLVAGAGQIVDAPVAGGVGTGPERAHRLRQRRICVALPQKTSTHNVGLVPFTLRPLR